MSERVNGTIYKNGVRYWWKVRLPGESKISYIPLKPSGAKFATKDLLTAEIIAKKIWEENLFSGRSSNFDGKISTLTKMYHAHNLGYYLPPSNAAVEIKWAITAFAEYYSGELAEDMTPVKLKEFRQHIVGKDKWSRRTINTRINMIRRMFKWAASEMLISIHIYTSLTTIENLLRGRTTAREKIKVLPVSIEAVAAVLPLVTPVVADMIQVQLLTGMRPGEVLKMRPGDIDCSDRIWKYTPTGEDDEYGHKTEYLGTVKYVAIGPKAQKVLAKYLFRKPSEYCFKPAESAQQSQERKHEKRKTPASYGNRRGTNNQGTQIFNDRFDTNSFRRAVQRACTKAGIDKWYPHQLRHTAATEISAKFDIDAARAVLGHTTLKQTEEYVERDFGQAKDIAEKMG